jgi:AcrR family transcriptional regulator
MSTEPGLRERGKQRRTGRILQSARELLNEAPDEPLTIERIAARAEVSAPTIFNLIGRRDEIWAALAAEGLSGLNLEKATEIEDDRDRAQAIVAEMVDMFLSDAAVFRAVLANWTNSGSMLPKQPTRLIRDCFAGHPGVDARRAAELVTTALLGVAHQWSARLIDDKEARRRGRDIVDLAFRAADAPGPPVKRSAGKASAARRG